MTWSRKKGAMRYTQKQIANGLRLYASGLSWRAVALETGISEATLRRHCDYSRDPSEALELAWREGRCNTNTPEQRRKNSERLKAWWAKQTDRGAINRKRWEYVRLMNA